LALVRSLVLFLSITTAAATPAAELQFTEQVINAGFNVEQPVLIASLTGDTRRHIVLAGRDENYQQRLAVYEAGRGAKSSADPLLSLRPGPNLIAYDVGRIGDRDALFFIEPGRILRYDFSDDEFVEVVKIRTIYGQSRSDDITPINFIRDINDDDRDDLVVPDTAGYRIRLQRVDGSFGEESLLTNSSSMTVTDGIVSFESRPLINGDMNFDGLSDLAVWRGDVLHIYPQLPDWRYQGDPQVLALQLDLLSEAELLASRGRFGSVNQNGRRENVIWSIEDLNGDQIPDILTESTLSEGVFDKRNDFRLHLGRRDGNQLAYRQNEDALLASEGLQYGLIATDIDGDGKKDLLARKVNLTFGRVIRALISGNVSLQLHFFRMTNDSYVEPANHVAKTNVRFSVTSGHVDIPAIKIADFDADGQQDLMMQTKTDRLSFFHGVPTEELFAEDAIEVDIDLPRNGDLVTTDDVDEDGRADLIIRFGAADGDKSSHAVHLMLSDI